MFNFSYVTFLLILVPYQNTFIDGEMYSVAHPLVRNILLNIHGIFPWLVIRYCSNLLPKQLTEKNITQYGE